MPTAIRDDSLKNVGNLWSEIKHKDKGRVDSIIITFSEKNAKYLNSTGYTDIHAGGNRFDDPDWDNYNQIKDILGGSALNLLLKKALDAMHSKLFC